MAEKKYLFNGVEKTREELFNEADCAILEKNQQLLNDVGFGDHDITLLTVIEREVSQQKFYQVNPEGFVPFDLTQGGWADYMNVWRNYFNSDGKIDAGKTRVDADK